VRFISTYSGVVGRRQRAALCGAPAASSSREGCHDRPLSAPTTNDVQRAARLRPPT